jgi:hypothetical protein
MFGQEDAAKMNAVEIEEAIPALAELPFDNAEFPFQFLSAFGNEEIAIKRLRRGESNKSGIGGSLPRTDPRKTSSVKRKSRSRPIAASAAVAWPGVRAIAATVLTR